MFLGHLECGQINRQAVEGWVVYAEAMVQPKTRTIVGYGKKTTIKNPHAGQPYAQDTMRKWWRCLCTLLGDMAADLNLPNPTTRVREPERPELPLVREQRTLDFDGIGAVLALAKEKFPLRYAEVAVIAMTGMRAGECYGLKWDVVDFDESVITIRRAVSRGVLREMTKTKVQRVVPMHPELAVILKAHRADQVAKQHPGLAAGLVFSTRSGGIRDTKGAKKVWAQLAEALESGLRVGPQVVRRSLNTQLVMAGVDRITTRAIMGHTSEAMTQRYAGIGDEAKASAVALIRRKPAAVSKPT